MNMTQQEKEVSMQTHKDVLAQLEQLVEKEQPLSKAFKDLDELKKQWNELEKLLGLPSKEEGEQYQRLLQAFQYHARVYKELKENDLKRNLEQKTDILQKLQSLSSVQDITELDEKFRVLRNAWSDVGPTYRESWEGLRTQFNQLAQVFYDKLAPLYEVQNKERDEKSQKKKDLFAKVQEITTSSLKTQKDWDNATKQLQNIENEWNAMGFVAGKIALNLDRQIRRVYTKFYKKKRVEYKVFLNAFDESRQRKEELIAQATEHKDSEKWQEAIPLFDNLQKEWSKAGFAGAKHQDKLWHSFKEICDHFYSRRKTYLEEQKSLEQSFESLKQGLIVELQAWQPSEDAELATTKLLEFTERATEWTTQAKTLTLKIRMILEEKIGQTILNAEEKINLAKQITKKLFEKDDRPLDVIIAREKSFLTQQADKIRKEVQSSENNLAFFGNNASAKLLLKDVNQKLDKDKAVLASLEAQIQQLSKMQRQFK